MKKTLLDLLVCPACLPGEKPLKASSVREGAGEIESAVLSCPGCGREYPVAGGVPVLASGGPAGEGYEGRAMLAAYLWSHYADLWGDPEANRAYADWAGLMPGCGLFLDAGSSVGRMALEMSAKAEFSIGLDLSRSFVAAARALVRDGGLGFDLPVEGRLAEPAVVPWQDAWRAERVDFLVADVLALPFPGSVFSGVSSLNLLDKVADPLGHLAELDRVAARRGASLLAADPFSWSEEAADPALWLGGTDSGPYAGRGLDNLAAILARDMSLPWRILDTGIRRWYIRHHANRHERIRSGHVLAGR